MRRVGGCAASAAAARKGAALAPPHDHTVIIHRAGRRIIRCAPDLHAVAQDGQANPYARHRAATARLRRATAMSHARQRTRVDQTGSPEEILTNPLTQLSEEEVMFRDAVLGFA